MTAEPRPKGRPSIGEDGQHPTYCRLCEAFCGMVATVESGRIAKLEPDRNNPHSQGHVCVKGVAFHKVTHDPDRLLTPLKRVGGPGEFEPVEWDEALADIASRLGHIRGVNGPEAVAFYIGNPASYSSETVIGHSTFTRALGSQKTYSPGSQDTNSRFVANYALFGSAALNAFPDLPNCEFLLVFGANPLVSNGSLIWAPRIRHDLDAIAARGRVVVIDPRRTETAKRYEHVPVRPGGDVWLLLAMLHVLDAEGAVDLGGATDHIDGLSLLLDEVRMIDLVAASRACGVDRDVIKQLAMDFARAPRAAAYARLGLCRGPFSTLANALLTTLNVVTGNFGGRRGGTIFGHRVLAGQEKGKPGGYDEIRSRIGNIPSVLRLLPGLAMPGDILEPGEGQVRALFVTAGNPLLTAPGGERLEEALAALELCVSLDLYMNETARHAHYILPVPTFLERADVPYTGMQILMRPFLHHAEAVLPPQGGARHEQNIYREIIEKMGLPWPGDIDPPLSPGLARIDTLLRAGPIGDALGSDGWSIERLRGHPHGVMLDLPDPTERWWERLGHPDGKVQLAHPLVLGELKRLRGESRPPPALVLIGRRDIRSMNSWLHNVEELVRSQKPRLILHPEDAARWDVANGEEALLSTRDGSVTVLIVASDEMMPGTCSYPHGWGHEGGWMRANAAPGDNINLLLGLGPDTLEAISGTTVMEGFAVTLTPLQPSAK